MSHRNVVGTRPCLVSSFMPATSLWKGEGDRAPIRAIVKAIDEATCGGRPQDAMGEDVDHESNATPNDDTHNR